MPRHVAFMRAVNVAGHGTVKMEDLRRAFAAAGCRDVQSYIQSGNVIYQAPSGGRAALEKEIRSRAGRLLGEEATVIFRSLRRLQALVKADPFAGVGARRDVKLYVAFLARRPTRVSGLPLRDGKEQLEAFALEGSDVFIVSGRKKNGFYGFPNNFIEKELGVSATSRNWNTVRKIVEKFA